MRLLKSDEVEAVVVSVEDVPNDIDCGDLVTDDVVEAAPNKELGGCGLIEKVEAAVVVAVEAPKVKAAAAPNVKVEVPVLGTLVVTDPNPDKLFLLGFEVEAASEPKLKAEVEAVLHFS